jgi:hypothetical protein
MRGDTGFIAVKTRPAATKTAGTQIRHCQIGIGAR